MWYWLLTSTTYGTWLPGDRRGSVTSVRDYRTTDPVTTHRVEHDRVGEPWEPPALGLYRSSLSLMKGEPVLLSGEQAGLLIEQFRISADYRGWKLLAMSIMANHFHLVVEASIDTDPEKMLQTFKSYGSRRLNESFRKPQSGTWWTKSGSRRKLPDEAAVATAIHYVLHKQPNPLVAWEPTNPPR